jgi:UDP-2-acetamido-2,6-beta-L-arabino-hexul-4-ose reductase
MSVIAMTGAQGFLGWHTRVALHSMSADVRPLPVGVGFNAAEAATVLGASDTLIHIAGVNRATDDVVIDGNVGFAEQLASVLGYMERPPNRLVYANSTQAGNGTPYGSSKERAAEILAGACTEAGIEFFDARLPNIFGEHGKPFYNSVVATFCHELSRGHEPSVESDALLTLMHAQDAADLLIGCAVGATTVDITVSELARRLRGIAVCYSEGQIPDLVDPFSVNLFNTYRSHAFEVKPVFSLHRNADHRGSFVETTRSHGGPAQSSFSTTAHDVIRGDHYHRRKVERFVVLSGSGTISLRRMFGDTTIELPVTGDNPVAVDMPTMWAHRIVNTAPAGELFTAFWSNELFDPKRPDTYPEKVLIDD